MDLVYILESQGFLPSLGFIMGWLCMDIGRKLVLVLVFR